MSPADNATGSRLESLMNRHPKTATAGLVVFILLLQVLGALLDGNTQ